MVTTENERIAEIEVLFRAGNDRMAAWPESRERADRGDALMLLCECGLRGCREHLRVEASAYEAVRADPMLFLVSSGHEIPETEDVVADHGGYAVVRKHEDVRELVERLNLRAGDEA